MKQRKSTNLDPIYEEITIAAKKQLEGATNSSSGYWLEWQRKVDEDARYGIAMSELSSGGFDWNLRMSWAEEKRRKELGEQ